MKEIKNNDNQIRIWLQDIKWNAEKSRLLKKEQHQKQKLDRELTDADLPR